MQYLFLLSFIAPAAVLAWDGPPTLKSGEDWQTAALRGIQSQGEGDLATARRYLAVALSLARSAERHPVEIAALHNRLASVDLEAGELELARLDLQRALAILARCEAEGREERIVALLQLSMLNFHQRRFQQACEHAEEALSERDLAPAAAAVKHAEAHQQFAVSLHAAHRPAEAMRHFQHAREHCTPPGSCPAEMHATLAAGIGLMKAMSGEEREGVAELRRSLSIFESCAAAPVLRLRPQNNLAVLLLRARQPRPALELIDDALQKATLALGPQHPLTATILLNRSAALRQLGKKREAREAKEAAQQTMIEWEKRNELHHSVEYADLLAAEGLPDGPSH